MEQPSILQLSRAGYAEAKCLLDWKHRFDVTLVLCACGALFLESDLAYLSSLVALVLKILSWMYRNRGLSMHGVAERAKRQAMLLDALGFDEKGAEFAELRSEFGQTITATATGLDAKSYYFSAEPCGPARMRDNVLESAFWSKHLYRQSAKRALRTFAILLVAVLAALLLAIPNASSDVALLLSRVLVILLGSALMFEHLGYRLAWIAAAEDSGRALHRAETLNLDIGHHGLALFGDYSAATAAAPPIPEVIYKKHEEHLNAIWKTYQSKQGRC